MLSFRFDFAKTIQAAAFLLNLEKRKMSYLRLIKLLYITDRTKVLHSGRPLTRDRVVAMKNGPVLSHLLDIIKSDSPPEEWTAFFKRNGYEIELLAEPSSKKLSKSDKDTLMQVHATYLDLDDWELVEQTHDFEEWKKNFPGGNGAGPIDWEQVLVDAGKADWVESIRSDEKASEQFDDLLATVHHANG